MAVRERYSSPDGSLVLVVDDTDGNLAVAFEGFEWHTHGDALVGSYGATEAEAIAEFVDQILSDRLAIAVCRRNGAMHDVRVTDDPATEHEYAPAYSELVGLRGRPQTAELRGASGNSYQVEVEIHWDGHPGGAVRVLGSIDDGGLRSFRPISQDFILASDGRFVGE